MTRRSRSDGGGLGRGFGRLWASGAVSNLGDGVMLAAAPLLAATLTRDPLLVALVAFSHRLPWLLFTLHSGALVDRLDRRRAMWVADAFRTVLVGALGLAVLLEEASVPLLCAIFFLAGAAETLFDTASQAILPQVVARTRLARANGRLQGARIVANNLAGPSLGASLFAFAAAVPFLLSAGGFAAAAALVFALRGSFRAGGLAGSVGEPPPAAPRASLLSEVAEGARWLFERQFLRTLAAVACAINVAFGAGFSVLVLFAQELLSLGALGYGLLLSGGALGGLAGSVLSARTLAWLGEGRTLLSAVLVTALAYAAMALTRDPILFGAAWALRGFALVLWNVTALSLRQAAVPEHLLGRVSSTYLTIARRRRVGRGARGWARRPEPRAGGSLLGGMRPHDGHRASHPPGR